MSDKLKKTIKNKVVLGSGNKMKKSQVFILPKEFFTSSDEPNIAISVDNVQWTRVTSLNRSKPTDKVYILRTDENGKTTVQFGDGRMGAKLPTGRNNVVATYRAGGGAAGNIGAGGSLKKSKPKKLLKKEKVEKNED